MSKVKAVVVPDGVTQKSPSEFTSERVSTENDVPTVEHIGEAVHEAVEKAWKAGYDPAKSPLVVVLTFE